MLRPDGRASFVPAELFGGESTLPTLVKCNGLMHFGITTIRQLDLPSAEPGREFSACLGDWSPQPV